MKSVFGKFFSKLEGNRGWRKNKVIRVKNMKFHVNKVLGEGGSAVVYEVRSAIGDLYALKRVIVNNTKDLKLAKQEILITELMSDCPNSVTYFNSSIKPVKNDVYEVYILMELCSGQSVIDLLNSRLERKTLLSESEVLVIFSDVLTCVTRMHHNPVPIIHRDLKIENILSSGQKYILCDYGSCTFHAMEPHVEGMTKCEEEIDRFTTLSYRSPEMISFHSGKKITEKSDIWALGCLLYKLCFMRTPFGEKPLAILSGHVMIPRNSPYSSGIHFLMRYLLQVDPAKRPSIDEITDIVQRLKVDKKPFPENEESLPPAPATSITLATISAAITSRAPIRMPSTSSSIRSRPRPSFPIQCSGILPPPPSRCMQRTELHPLSKPEGKRKLHDLHIKN